MNAVIEPAAAETPHPPLHDAVRSACRRIPPLWSLRNFVAVNPFVSWIDLPFVAGAQLVQRVGHGEMLMPAAFYREQVASGRIQEGDFRTAVELAGETLPADWAEHLNFAGLKEWDQAMDRSRPLVEKERMVTFADFLDLQNRGDWAAFVTEEISKWCSAYYDQGQSSWRMPWRDRGLFAAWKAAARLDANPGLCGLKQFRDFVSTLPEDPLEVIDRALSRLGVPARAWPEFLHRQLMSHPGWSGCVQFHVRERGMAGHADDSLEQLLAIRLAYDVALRNQFGDEPPLAAAWADRVGGRTGPGSGSTADLAARYVAQQALECGYQRELIAKLKARPAGRPAEGRKTLQAVFCIDVRSEVFRRSLEAQSEEIETIGFAGFFGMAIEYLKFGQPAGGARCPVLLTPKIRVREALRDATAEGEGELLRKMNFRRTVNGAWNSFKTSAISCFSFVETAGLWFGVKLAKGALGLAAPESAFADGAGSLRFGPKLGSEICRSEGHGCDCETGIPPADQIALAAGALKNMGLTSNFAKVVLICGHGAATSNNPYGSALDCGACGGHAGDANARVAAAILNQPAVRAALEADGIQIPADTLFIAGLHNTTTDEILIYDDEALRARPPAEPARIRTWLTAASKAARRERAASLGLADAPEAGVDELVCARSRDWSQVRPEWGLAGNAAFIAAPRARTKGLNLGGRAFLHNYDARRDPDHSVLELIMAAPMVVASWINLQYYGSTVDNRLFGSGNKVIHNVVGTFGVWQGNGGDLQPGLPLQSLHDGVRWMHEPLRLNVFIEAETGAIEKVMAKHPDVRNLIQNGWVNLFAMDASGGRFWRYRGNRFAEEAGGRA